MFIGRQAKGNQLEHVFLIYRETIIENLHE